MKVLFDIRDGKVVEFFHVNQDDHPGRFRVPTPEEAYQAGRESKAAEILEVLVRDFNDPGKQ